ncbi:MAG TPA: hypothetical protein DCP08_06540 [Chloroflexi bacterium]|nr:hypothetical protein [Chloroflexota bacterium]
MAATAPLLFALEERLRQEGLWEARVRRVLHFLRENWTRDLEEALRGLPDEDEVTLRYVMGQLAWLAQDPTRSRLEQSLEELRELEECEILSS